jgi:hypothetical protein
MSMLCCIFLCPCYAVSLYVHVMLYRFLSMLCCIVFCPCYAVSFCVHVMLYRFMSVLCCIVFCPCYALSFCTAVKHYPSLQAIFPHSILTRKDIVCEVFFLPVKVPLYTGLCAPRSIFPGYVSLWWETVDENKYIHPNHSLICCRRAQHNQIFNKGYSLSVIDIIITLRPQ